MRLRHATRLTGFFSSLLIKRWLWEGLDVRPVVAELFLTDNCNLKCVTCACWRSHTPEELTTEEWKEVVNQLGELGFVKLNFTGGEALLRRDATEIIRHAHEQTDATLHLNTNAILLTAAKTKELIEAGVRSFNVSFDGATAEMHDHVRGQKGAFAKTLEHFGELVQLRERHGLRLRMCFTVMRENMSEMVEMAKLAQRMRAPLFFNVLTDHTFLFRGHDIVKLGEVRDEGLEGALNALLEHKKKHPEYLPRYSVICYIGDHFKDQLQKKLPCTEANLKLMVHSQGQVGGCWAHDPEFSVREQRIEAMLETEKFKTTQTDLFFKRCKGCGSNHALNMRLEPRPMMYDALWKAGIFKKRKKLFA